MLFNNYTDTVIGKFKLLSPTSLSGEIYVIGIYKENQEFIKLSQDQLEINFPPQGKVFVPDIEVLKSKGIDNKNLIEFSTQAIQPQKNFEYDDYAIDSYSPIHKIEPNILFIQYLTRIDTDLKYHIDLNFLNLHEWVGYVYDTTNQILYERIKNYGDIGIEAEKGTYINGINYEIYNDSNFIISNDKVAYVSKTFSPFFNKENIVDTIDLSNRSQKIDWFKKKVKQLNKFSERDLQYLYSAFNKLKVSDYFEENQLVSVRKNEILALLDKVVFSNEEIKGILQKDSNIGSYLLEQIIEKKNLYCKEIFAKMEKEVQEKKKQINLDFQEQDKINNELSAQNQILTNSILELNTKKEELEKEMILLKKNKELIYTTIKAITDNQTSSIINKIQNNGISINKDLEIDDYNYDIYKIDTDLEKVENEDIEDCFYRYTKNYKLDKILKNKFSLVPSISWPISLARYLGNSEFLNMSVEYDWLHYSDFVKHGFIHFIKECIKSPEKFFFLHLDNLNIIPLDCGFSSIYKVFNKEKPFFNGTSLPLPENLFVTATLIPTKVDQSTGNTIPERYKDLFNGIETPNKNINLKSDKAINKFRYCYNKDFKTFIDGIETQRNNEYYDY